MEHGYLTERELPTGEDEFDDREDFSNSQKRNARSRACYGAFWIENNDTRLECALDSSTGVFGPPIPLLVAVKVYEQWGQCFYHGVIRRHTDSERLLGGHAMVLLGFVKLSGVIWGLLGNSWGNLFASESPIDVPGIALISTEYLQEIMYHGSLYIARNEAEFNQLDQALTSGNAFSWQSEPWRRQKDRVAVLASQLKGVFSRNSSAFAKDKAQDRKLIYFTIIGLLVSILPGPIRQFLGICLLSYAIVELLPRRVAYFVRLFHQNCSVTLRGLLLPISRARRRRAATIFIGGGLLVASAFSGLPPSIGVLLALFVILVGLRCSGPILLRLCMLVLGGALCALAFTYGITMPGRIIANFLGLTFLIQSNSSNSSCFNMRILTQTKPYVLCALAIGAFAALLST